MIPHLSLTGRQWLLRRDEEFGSADDVVMRLATERQLLDVIQRQQMKLSDPSLFTEMGRAVERIDHAMAENEVIAIFGDYDADGITGTAQLVRFFRRRGIDPVIYLPHRMREGYGMKNHSIDALHEKDVTLIITVDTGIASHEQIERAKSHGIDVIVTDHHHPSNGRPPAYAVIHPQVPDAFPNEHISGSGVAFMLLRALEKGQAWDGIAEDFVLATIGTVADMVPLTGENRTLVMYGLKCLQQLPPGPIKTFADSLRSKEANLSSTDIAFRLVPRINASGRMDDPIIALNALLEGGEAIAKLDELNTHRRSFTADLFDQASATLDLSQPFIVLADEKYTAGIVGLIAGKLTEEYGRPSLVAAIVGDICTGSLRSIPQFNIMDALTHPTVKPLLLTFGGHAQAAGCTFALKDLDTLRAALNAVMIDAGFTSDTLIPVLEIDAPVTTDHLSHHFIKSLSNLEPYGQANAEPLFLLRNQTITGLRCIGTDGRHLQCRIGQTKAIAFNFGGHEPSLSSQPDQTYDIACRFTLNKWNGREDLQIVIEDIRHV